VSLGGFIKAAVANGQPARGLLWNGQRILIPGIEVIGPGDASWCKMDSHDYQPRKLSDWPRQTIVHTTKGIYDPKRGEVILQGKGPGGKDVSTANYWSLSQDGKATAGGAPLVVDDDGSIACLIDLFLYFAYHATTSNKFSHGIEMFQRLDGGVTTATLESTVTLSKVLCGLNGVPTRSTA
jgi:hypothetical protein